MPSRVNGEAGSSRFELPALDLNFGSITDGTNIPPPPDSPVHKVPTPPQTPRPEAQETKIVKQEKVEAAEAKVADKPATTNEGQQSNGNGAAAPVNRPLSRSGTSILDDRKSKRSSGWFKRLTSGDSSAKRSSVILEQPPTTAQASRPSGPPPPMIPELKEFEKEESGFGSDLFKNIK